MWTLGSLIEATMEALTADNPAVAMGEVATRLRRDIHDGIVAEREARSGDNEPIEAEGERVEDD